MYAWKSWRNMEVFYIEGGEAVLWTDLVDSGIQFLIVLLDWTDSNALCGIMFLRRVKQMVWFRVMGIFVFLNIYLLFI
jgi:hypothetical protein